jgi:DNA-binding NarL/FixJ family response regulator
MPTANACRHQREVPKRSPEKRKVLTVQEEQIGRLARDDLSNPEISGQIFITARTVECCDSSSFRCRGWRRAWSRRAHGRPGRRPLALV